MYYCVGFYFSTMKKIILVFILIINLLTPTHTAAQYGSKLEAGFSNVALGGLVGGVGAVINKKKSAKFGKTFWKGFYKGAIGGYLIYEGKNLIHKGSINTNSNYYWPAKLVHATGSSIIENAAANRGMLAQIHLTFGFNRIDCYTKKKFKLRYRILSSSLLSGISYALKYHFDIKETFKTGVFIFYDNKDFNINNRFHGMELSNNVVLSKAMKLFQSNNLHYSPSQNRFGSLFRFHVIGHEIIHTYQYESTFALNMFLNKPLKKLNKIKVVNWYQKYFYTEYNAVLFRFYNTKNRNNFIEKEADFYSINR